MTYLFFDTETTGLPKNYKAPAWETDNWPRLVQLAWIATDELGNQKASGNWILKPVGYDIPKEVSEIHGISHERAVNEGLDMKTQLDEFAKWVNDTDFIVAHNLAFDEKIVSAEYHRAGYFKSPLYGKQRICTMMGSTKYCALPNSNGRGGNKWPKLNELHTRLFGKEFEGAHDASVDIAATVKCYFELVKRNVMSLTVNS